MFDEFQPPKGEVAVISAMYRRGDASTYGGFKVMVGASVNVFTGHPLVAFLRANEFAGNRAEIVQCSSSVDDLLRDLEKANDD